MKKKNIDFSKFSLILALFVSNIASAQMTSIPDPAFEQFLVDQVIDSDGLVNGQVLTSDISGLSELDIQGYNISNFEGLQFFSSLINFTLINDQATTINNIDFSGNLLLTKLSIINVPNLSQINILQNINIVDLTVVSRGNLFNSIDVSANLNLTNLSLADNALSNLNLSTNTNLTSLSVAINPITNIETSNLTELENLDTYESEITSLDLSKNTKLTRLNSDDGKLTKVNLKNAFNTILTSVELNNNPDLSCILVDNVANANAAAGWVKDATATYIDEPIFIETEAQDIPLQYDSAGNYKTDVDAWLANNGGAVATSGCGEITWSSNVFEFFVQSSTKSIVYGVEFMATDIFGNTKSTVVDLTVGNINHFEDETYGKGDTACDDIFDLNKVITDDPFTAQSSLKAENVKSFSFENAPSSESNAGPLTSKIQDTDVDFPDTGAGSYFYKYQVSIENAINVYNPVNGAFEEEIITEEAVITINDKTVAFKTEELDDITVSSGVISSIQYLTDLLVITPDPNVLAPQNPIDLNQYWTPSVYSGPGTYVFDPTAAFPNCPSNAVSITVSESTLSIYESELLKNISIYPNPTREMLHLKGDISLLKRIEIYSTKGQQILAVTKNFDEIDVSNLKSTLYFVKLHTENTTKVAKIIKE